jgi:hypothetical protein
MIEWTTADKLLAYGGIGAPATKSVWPFQKYPEYSDFKQNRVVCHPLWEQAAEYLRNEESVLLFGRPSSGKTLTSRKIAFELLNSFDIRFCIARTLYEPDGPLSAEFVQLLLDWRNSELRMLGVVEDVHEPGFRIADFLNQVEAHQVTWLFTSRIPQPLLETVGISITPERNWLESVVAKLSELLRNSGRPGLPVEKVVTELCAYGQPDLRALHYLIKAAEKNRLPEAMDVRTSILHYLHGEYLQGPRATALLRLCAIARFEADCEATFVPDLPEALVDQARIEQVERDGGISGFLRLDAGFARWCLEAANQFGAGMLKQGQEDAFVLETLKNYLNAWAGRSFDLLMKLGNDDPALARNVLADKPVFDQIKRNLGSCSAATFVQLLRHLGPQAKQELSGQAAAPSLRTYLRLSQHLQFGSAIYQLSLSPDGLQIVAELGNETILSRLNDSSFFYLYILVFQALRHWPDRLRWLVERVDFAQPLQKANNLRSFIVCATLLKKFELEDKLLEAARAQPAEELARLAQNSKLRDIGWTFHMLSRDPNWAADRFIDECGPLTTSFRTATISAAGEFLSLLKRRVNQRKNQKLREAWFRFCDRLMAAFDVSKLSRVEEVGYLCGGLNKTSRTTLLKKLIHDPTSSLGAIINQVNMKPVVDCVEALCSREGLNISEAGEILGLVREETWNRWLSVGGDGWEGILCEIPVLLKLHELHHFSRIPEGKLAAKLLEFSSLDVESRKRILSSVGLSRFMDILRTFVEKKYAIPPLLEACDAEIVRRWTSFEIADKTLADRQLGLLRGLGKMVAIFCENAMQIPAWVNETIEGFPYQALPINPQTVDALNKLARHLKEAGFASTQFVHGHLLRMLDEKPALLRDSRFSLEWLWNLLVIAGHHPASEWLNGHRSSYLEAVQNARTREAIFLLWNGWLISEGCARAAVRIPRTNAILSSIALGASVDDAKHVEAWEKWSFLSIVAVLGAPVSYACEESERTEIEHALAKAENPAVKVLLTYARSHWITMSPPSAEEVGGLLAEFQESTREQIRLLLQSANVRK